MLEIKNSIKQKIKRETNKAYNKHEDLLNSLIKEANEIKKLDYSSSLNENKAIEISNTLKLEDCLNKINAMNNDVIKVYDQISMLKNGLNTHTTETEINFKNIIHKNENLNEAIKTIEKIKSIQIDQNEALVKSK